MNGYYQDDLGHNPRALTADVIPEETGDEGVQSTDEGEQEKGGRGVDHDETLDDVDEILDHVDEMDEFTEFWSNLGLRTEVIENWMRTRGWIEVIWQELQWVEFRPKELLIKILLNKSVSTSSKYVLIKGICRSCFITIVL